MDNTSQNTSFVADPAKMVAALNRVRNVDDAEPHHAEAVDQLSNKSDPAPGDGHRARIPPAADQSEDTPETAAAADPSFEFETLEAAVLTERSEANGSPAGDAPLLVAAAELEDQNFDAFPAAPHVEGEFMTPLNSLVISPLLKDRFVDLSSGGGLALLHAALRPECLPPLKVISVGNQLHVVDGRARVAALLQQHRQNPETNIRVVSCGGTEKDAVLSRFFDELLKLGHTKIEIAHQLRGVIEDWNVSQTVLAARMGWSKTKVTKLLTAADLDAAELRFRLLLDKQDDPSVEYLYWVGAAHKVAIAEDNKHQRRSPDKGEVAKLINRREALIKKGATFKAAAALVALGLREPLPDPELPFGREGGTEHEPVSHITIIEDLFGDDDQPIGAVELHPDGGLRLLVPPQEIAQAMTCTQRDVARATLHRAVDKLLGI